MRARACARAHRGGYLATWARSTRCYGEIWYRYVNARGEDSQVVSNRPYEWIAIINNYTVRVEINSHRAARQKNVFHRLFTRRALMYANIRGYGSKYLRWVSYINCIMHVCRIYQASRLYADFVAPGTALALFSLYRVVASRWNEELQTKCMKTRSTARERKREKREREGREKETHLLRYTSVRELRSSIASTENAAKFNPILRHLKS